jgi:asparagine synthase (glutamine-hydrolysing)
MEYDGRYYIVFNGEIYNFGKIKNKLILENNVKFKTNSDTEVLLQFLVCYGTSKLSELNGMFSFVFYDKDKDLCIVARDPYGIKPLFYYTYQDGTVIYSSEVKAILEVIHDRELDDERIAEALSHRFRCTGHTFIKAVTEFPPGEV